MTYTFLSAAYANAEHTAAVAMTAEAAAVLLSAVDTPKHWAALHAALMPAPYAPPAPAVPQSVTRFQAKAALAQAGKLAEAQALVDASTEPLVKLAWAEAATFERRSPMLLAMAPLLWPTNTEVALDAIFVAAAGISA